jgi:hypothetical protein
MDKENQDIQDECGDSLWDKVLTEQDPVK